MNRDTTDDNDLIAAARGGDTAAFEALVRRFSPSVYTHALRFFGDDAAAQDASQEVFIKVYRTLDGFDGRARFSTWLYRVTRNTCLDMVRASRHRPVSVDPVTLDIVQPGDLADQVVLAASAEAAMGALAPEDRDALCAVSLFGLSYEEAAAVLAVPPGTVKSRVFRARRLMARSLGLTGGD